MIRESKRARKPGRPDILALHYWHVQFDLTKQHIDQSLSILKEDNQAGKNHGDHGH
jgi:hypothetical protein